MCVTELNWKYTCKEKNVIVISVYDIGSSYCVHIKKKSSINNI